MTLTIATSLTSHKITGIGRSQSGWIDSYLTVGVGTSSGGGGGRGASRGSSVCQGVESGGWR